MYKIIISIWRKNNNRISPDSSIEQFWDPFLKEEREHTQVHRYSDSWNKNKLIINSDA